MDYIKAFAVGGALCLIGQILIDKTKLTSARILVLFVTAGAILSGLGVYQYLVDLREYNPLCNNIGKEATQINTLTNAR